MDQSPQPKAAYPKPAASSRITNGGCWLPAVDGRTRVARRIRDLTLRYEAELGYPPTEAHRSLCKLAATYCAAVEQMAAQLAQGKPIDPDHLVKIGNAMRSTLSLLGISGRSQLGQFFDHKHIAQLSAARWFAIEKLLHQCKEQDTAPSVTPMDVHRK